MPETEGNWCCWKFYSFDKADYILREAPDSFDTTLVAVFVISSDHIAATAQLITATAPTC